jgi:glycerol-3-phosphate dehydrogenase
MMMKSRRECIQTIRENPEVSVLIIGAGINGIGTFRDLSLQGVDVLLVDRGDFCSGASAASSHMVHGGIRYLENGEFRLVREAVRERNLLIQNAPHYVNPLPTTFPIFKWFSGIFNAPLKFLRILDKPAERGALVIKIGMMLYDAYTGVKRTVPKHTFRSRQRSLELFPKLNPEIIFTATYYDASMPIPERICIDLIHDTEETSMEAKAINYMPVVGMENGSVHLKDALNGEILTVRPNVVVNAAGPWIDFVNQALGQETTYIGGTKGSHLVLDHPELRAAIGDHEFFFENRDGRIVLIFPLEDKVLVGTSDIRIDDPDDAQCTEEEVDYFFEMIKRVFPDIAVNRSQIVYRFSGVRPLPFSQASLTGQISRDHKIEQLEPTDGLHFPILSLVGGKWTSFRAFSEQVTDLILEKIGKQRKISTEHLAIGGGKEYPESEEAKEGWLGAVGEKTGLPDARLSTLFERYGTRAAEVAEFIAIEKDNPLQYDSSFSVREILFLVEQEKIVHLEDLVRRRSNLMKLGELTPELVEELVKILQKVFGWSEEACDNEIARVREDAEAFK